MCRIETIHHIAITNRHLVRGDFSAQLARVLGAGSTGVGFDAENGRAAGADRAAENGRAAGADCVAENGRAAGADRAAENGRAAGASHAAEVSAENRLQSDGSLCLDPATESCDGLRSAALSRPDMVILREKDLNDEAYRQLAAQVQPLCKTAGAAFVVNGRPWLAAELSADGLQMSFAGFCAMIEEGRSGSPGGRRAAAAGETVWHGATGVSVHSPEEAVRAEKLGADWLIYGHVFATDCKPGVAPRGLKALMEVCKQVTIPVFAIGGITAENEALCLTAGAAGVCMMSGYMAAK